MSSLAERLKRVAAQPGANHHVAAILKALEKAERRVLAGNVPFAGMPSSEEVAATVRAIRGEPPS